MASGSAQSHSQADESQLSQGQVDEVAGEILPDPSLDAIDAALYATLTNAVEGAIGTTISESGVPYINEGTTDVSISSIQLLNLPGLEASTSSVGTDITGTAPVHGSLAQGVDGSGSGSEEVQSETEGAEQEESSESSVGAAGLPRRQRQRRSMMRKLRGAIVKGVRRLQVQDGNSNHNQVQLDLSMEYTVSLVDTSMIPDAKADKETDSADKDINEVASRHVPVSEHDGGMGCVTQVGSVVAVLSGYAGYTDVSATISQNMLNELILSETASAVTSAGTRALDTDIAS